MDNIGLVWLIKLNHSNSQTTKMYDVGMKFVNLPIDFIKCIHVSISFNPFFS